MQPVQPLYTVELFPPLSRHLLTILARLTTADWARPTVCANWNVKQVALHLLGGNIGRLSARRHELDVPANLTGAYAELFRIKDALGRSGKKAESFAELVEWIDHANAEWVRANDSLDTGTLLQLLEWSDAQVYHHFEQLDPDATAGISVLWAGETTSLNWFDIAREYTEKWLHQQHIREAVGAPVLESREFLYPVLDIFLRALPHAYHTIAAPNGTTLVVEIIGGAGGAWSLVRQMHAWVLFSGRAANTAAHVTMDQALAWRLFTKGINLQAARPRVQIEGDVPLGDRVLKMVSIMA